MDSFLSPEFRTFFAVHLATVSIIISLSKIPQLIAKANSSSFSFGIDIMSAWSFSFSRFSLAFASHLPDDGAEPGVTAEGAPSSSSCGAGAQTRKARVGAI